MLAEVHQWYNIAALSQTLVTEVHLHFPAKTGRAEQLELRHQAGHSGKSLISWWEGADLTTDGALSSCGQAPWQHYQEPLSGGRLAGPRAGAQQPEDFKIQTTHVPTAASATVYRVCTDACTRVTWWFCYQQLFITLNASLDQPSKEKPFSSCLTIWKRKKYRSRNRHITIYS